MHIHVAFVKSYFKVFLTCHPLNKYTPIECRSLEVSLSISTNSYQVNWPWLFLMVYLPDSNIWEIA